MAVPAVVVRPARPEEAALMAAIERDAGERFRDVGMGAVADDADPPLHQYQEAQRRGHLFVATVEGTLAGYAWVVDLDGQPHLEQISVRRAYGGHGVGVALVDRARAWAVEQGGDSLTLSTFRDVAFNGPWYARLGFVEVPDPDADPRWREIRRHERAAGLDVDARIIMRLPS